MASLACVSRIQYFVFGGNLMRVGPDLLIDIWFQKFDFAFADRKDQVTVIINSDMVCSFKRERDLIRIGTRRNDQIVF